MKRMIPYNTTADGTAQTIKAQYYKNGYINFVEKDNQFGATGVLEIYEEEEKHDGRNLERP